MLRKETMTPRERWEAVLTHCLPDRAPTDYWATPELTETMLRHTGSATEREMLQKLGVDFVVSVYPGYVGPKPRAGEDIWGIRYRRVNYGSGTYDEVTHHPLAKYHSVEEIEAEYTWPQPDWWDYRGIAEQIKGWEQYPIRGGGSEPFLQYESLRGDEQAMIDLVEHPDIVEYCLDKLFTLAYINTQRIYEQIPGKVLITYVAEDMGAQTDLIFSPRHIRKFLLPWMKRMMDLVHQAGAFVFHHNDGNCTRILPELVQAGIDLLNPIQWRANGMDRQYLKDTYGERICFHGAVDNQFTLPFGTVEDVRREVAENIAILGKGGGYIVAPCHNIQPNTAPENVVAMYEAAREYGWY